MNINIETDYINTFNTCNTNTQTNSNSNFSYSNIEFSVTLLETYRLNLDDSSEILVVIKCLPKCCHKSFKYYLDRFYLAAVTEWQSLIKMATLLKVS